MPAPIISPTEYAERLEKVRASMRERGFDALLVADPANIHYLTGYDAWSFYMPQVLFVPVEGEPIFFLRDMDARGAHRTAVTDQGWVAGYPESYIHRADRHAGDWIAEELERRGVVRAMPEAIVGYEGEAHFFSVRFFETLRRRLPGWRFADCHDLVNWVRVVKSPAEIEIMRAAGRVASRSMEVAADAIRTGARRNDVAAAIMHAQLMGEEDEGGDYPSIVPLLAVGESADTPHLTWNSERLGADEPVTVELAGAVRRYHAPLARTVVPERVTPELDRLAGVTADGIEAVLAEIRAGRVIDEVARAWDDTIRRAGFEKASRLGYSIGIGYPPDWGERTLSIRAGEEVPLEENMTFHIIAGMWQTGYGCEISESVRVTDSGVELLTDAPRTLIRRGARWLGGPAS